MNDDIYEELRAKEREEVKKGKARRLEKAREQQRIIENKIYTLELELAFYQERLVYVKSECSELREGL